MFTTNEEKGFFDKLFDAIGSIFSFRPSGTTAPDYAGFTIDKLVGVHTTGGLPMNLLDLVEKNYKVVTAETTQGEVIRKETTVGWFIKLNKPSGIDYDNYSSEFLQPSGITQLVFVQKNINGVRSFEYKKYPVNVDLSSDLSLIHI